MTLAEQAWSFFKQKKCTPYAIASILGHLLAESKLLPDTDFMIVYNYLKQEKILGKLNSASSIEAASKAFPNFSNKALRYSNAYYDYFYNNHDSLEQLEYPDVMTAIVSKEDICVTKWRDQNWIKVIRPNDKKIAQRLVSCCNRWYQQNIQYNWELLQTLIPPTDTFKDITSYNYTNSKDYLQAGDILISSTAVAIVLSDGEKVGQITPTVIKVESYLARVTPRKVNIRRTPESDSFVIKQLNQGSTFVIIEEKNGWGKLRSGLGWINLKYIEKI